MLTKLSQLKQKLETRVHISCSPKDPVTVFHHIPKCGGTSLKRILREWYITQEDYRSLITMAYPEKKNLAGLKSCHCLCGHFEIDGYHLGQRYPEVFQNPRYRVCSFIRDPLEVRCSLYRYEAKENRLKIPDPVEHLFNGSNFIANCFPVSFENYRAYLDRYFFIGILEQKEKSLARLSQLTGKPFRPLLHLNRTQNSTAECGTLSRAFLDDFREKNSLDYEIYDYACRRLACPPT